MVEIMQPGPVPENPCLTCADVCCALKGDYGLRLSAHEFEAHFREHTHALRVRQEGEMVVLSTEEGRVCPNLGDKGCRIYAERPIDCRLYPYQMLPVYQTKRRVKIMLYMTPVCAADRTFAYPEQQARTLVQTFCRDVYGDKRVLIQIYQNRFLPKLRNKGAALFFQLCTKFGIDWP